MPLKYKWSLGALRRHLRLNHWMPTRSRDECEGHRDVAVELKPVPRRAEVILREPRSCCALPSLVGNNLRFQRSSAMRRSNAECAGSTSCGRARSSKWAVRCRATFLYVVESLGLNGWGVFNITTRSRHRGRSDASRWS